ncbi:MAG: hypothetical protein JKY23_06095 [Nitrospinaceae bacterium]|nr:hypothetical protein [Nitrospinaceae bacterium]
MTERKWSVAPSQHRMPHLELTTCWNVMDKWLKAHPTQITDYLTAAGYSGVPSATAFRNTLKAALDTASDVCDLCATPLLKSNVCRTCGQPCCVECLADMKCVCCGDVVCEHCDFPVHFGTCLNPTSCLRVHSSASLVCEPCGQAHSRRARLKRPRLDAKREIFAEVGKVRIW